MALAPPQALLLAKTINICNVMNDIYALKMWSA